MTLRHGYKVMRLDRATGELVSLADARQRFAARFGAIVEPRYPGLFLSPNQDYVLKYYASGDDADEALLTFEFDDADITRGNLMDREPEIAVRRARLLNVEEI